MGTKGWFLWRLFISAALLTSGALFVLGAGTAAQTLNLPNEVTDDAVVEDGDVPDVTARVARISFIRGEAQIKRSDGEEWEKATLNLPLVEGDEITTGADSRVEIQFDNRQHLRLAENGYLKLVVLKDEGIAVSLSLGSMALRITAFDKEKAYFEIDAPKSTIAVQKAGQYRVDAGQTGDSEIRIAVGEGGEARLYSENAGFTLKNGRSAKVFISGDNAGEWEAVDRAGYSDEFDRWSQERDELIARQLHDAYYDKYYDQDIYGADDLNGYGEWVHTSQYGYVWRPYADSIRSYADWSPYRYGSWRWVPPFGWTWVNDEPWGWATYHHGRWVYDNGFWYWSPYGYYRYTRSWWFPALVVINVFNDNVCWYPLGYHHSWHNYNAHFNNHNGGHHGHHQYPTGGIKAIPSPTPIRQPGKITHNANLATTDEVPPGGVVAIGADDFGKHNKVLRTVPLNVAKNILAKTPDYDASPVLPDYAVVTKKIGRDIIVERPKADMIAANTRVGAAPRKTDAPLDQELRTTRILGGRPPISDQPPTGGVRTIGSGERDPRRTGAVERPPVRSPTSDDQPVRQPPTRSDPPDQAPVRTPPGEPHIIRQSPASESQPVRQPPRAEPAPVRQPSRVEPAPARQPSRQDPPKSDPPSKAPPAKSGSEGTGGKRSKGD
jgi:FecR protein